MDLQTKQVMQVYSARGYTSKDPRKSNIIPVNVPEYLPTVPQDNKYTYLNLPGNYFANKNFPISRGSIKLSHSVNLPLMSGNNCPTIFDKGTKFTLLIPNYKIETGYLIYN